jgi:hypothetical protein
MAEEKERTSIQDSILDLSRPSASAGELSDALRRGFIVWSWIGLLGALTSSSAIFTNQIFLWTREGVVSYKIGGTQPLFASITVLFPLLILAIAWLTFYRYSIAIFEACVLGTHEYSHFSFDVVWLFRRCVFYLAAAWLAGILASIIPVMLAFFMR